MGKLTFYIVDVFAEQKYAGNQLGVFRGGQGLSTAEMQRLALEMNYSETSFILSETPQAGGFEVRIFTPKEEVPFAGHPTLGTAHVIRSEILKGAAEEVALNLKVGQIPVTYRAEGQAQGYYWMKQVAPEFGRQLPRAELAGILGLEEAEIDERFPIEEVSTGLPFTIVPLKTLASLQRARVNPEKYHDFAGSAWAKGILIFAPQPHEAHNDLSVRVFVDYLGIPEDPATGSGNGCLAGYLVKQRYFGGKQISVRCEQGYEIDRPSLLLLQAEEIDGKINVAVGGKALIVARGEFV